MKNRLYTKISKAYLCESTGNLKPAAIPAMKIWSNGPNEIYWLDKLFEGGILLPEHGDENRALTILLSGPPGSGKSTLALELCHRWNESTHCIKIDDDGSNEMEDVKMESLYITSETDEYWAIEKAKSLGWSVTEMVGTKFKKKIVSMPEIWQTIDFKKFIQGEPDSGISAGIIDAFTGFFGNSTEVSPLVDEIIKRWEKAKAKKKIDDIKPKVLVIDSLNTIESSKKSSIFQSFMTLINRGPCVIIIILESSQIEKDLNHWDYLADIVIRLDRENISDYLVRTIEIVKSRYQSHVWGKHQLKIYPPKNFDGYDTEGKRRAHPYRKQGGIFVYPSIHYYLSVYKHLKRAETTYPFETPLKSLEKAFTEGFPRGRCTGFIGMRGGHKSHLGYLSLLSQIVRTDRNERGLIISLRDDEGMARKTLNRILTNEIKYQGNLQRLEEEDKIELLYFPPGYITPEEVFHRVFISVQRLKSHGNDVNVTVLFNSLDQLSSRFPLCARQQIFVPGLIETLSAENVTGFFIAVEEPGQPPEQYGLLSMADALVSFTQKRFNKADYLGHIKYYLDIKSTDKYEKELPEFQDIVTLRITRFAGGQAAGAGGILELIKENEIKLELYNRDLQKNNRGTPLPGLVFVPFSSNYSTGENIYSNFLLKYNLN